MQPESFTVLLDAPTNPTRRIQIAKLGTYQDARYGEFDITADNVANWQKHLAKLPGGEALIDFEHRSERKPRDSIAAGWISSIDIDGDRVMADARWTPKGKTSIENEEYRFLSPVFGPTQVESETLDDALPSVALTNKPFLASMPAVCLASEERVSEAIDEDPALRFHVRALDGEYGDFAQALVLLDVSQAQRDQAHAAGHSLPDKSYPINSVEQLHAAAILAASGHGNAAAARTLIRRRAHDLDVDIATLPGFAGEKKQMSGQEADSRAPDMPSEALLKLLDLDDNADDAKLLEAISSLKAAADDAAKAQKKLDKKPLKTLEQQAKDSGLVLLDSKQVSELQRKAAAGETAMKHLHEQRFDTAFELALNDPRGARVTPAERESLQHFYTLDADATLQLIDARDPVVNAKPAGNPSLELSADSDPRDVLASGQHPESYHLDQRIRKHMLDNKIPPADYAKVMDQYVTGTVVL